MWLETLADHITDARRFISVSEKVANDKLSAQQIRLLTRQKIQTRYQFTLTE